MSIHVQSNAASSDWAFKRLFKLESECRSQIPSTQVQAIGEFSKLFDQFPFPMLVSSAFLKLGDLFRSSTNALRYHIVKVFEVSNQHLLRVTHTDELLKRIITVLYSNDPVARVLALQLIGNASIVFAKYPEAQHGVLLRFQSTHPLEIAAAVKTTEAMLTYSPEFLTIVWETLIGKINNQNTQDSVRCQLIYSLHHAMPNLQLSILLSDHCRYWLRSVSSTILCNTAILTTWRSIVQPYNQLSLEDALLVSKYISEKSISVSSAALDVLAKWRPTIQESTDHNDQINVIKERLLDFVKTQITQEKAENDIGAIRRTLVSIARIDKVCGIAHKSIAWDLAQSMFESFLDSCTKGDIHLEAVLDLLIDAKMDVDTDKSQSSHIPAQIIPDIVIRRIVTSGMLIIDIATTLGISEIQDMASKCIFKGWIALSRVSQPCSLFKYTLRFLRISWKWCVDMGVSRHIFGSFGELLQSSNKAIERALVAIRPHSLLKDRIPMSICAKHIEHMSLYTNGASKDPAEVNSSSFWMSLCLLLNASLKGVTIPDDCSDKKLAALIADLHEHTSNTDTDIAKAIQLPSPYILQKIFALAAECRMWHLVIALGDWFPTNKLSPNVNEFISAIQLISRAEICLNDQDRHQVLSVDALNSLQVLNNHGVPRLLQMFIVQLRIKCVHLEREFAAFKPAGALPMYKFVLRSLVDSAITLSEQCQFVLTSFIALDSTTKVWLINTQAALSQIATAYSKDEGDIARAMENISSMLKAQQLPKFALGHSFFYSPPNPKINIETRPNLSSLESIYTVLNGSEFHLTVEGFVFLPRYKLEFQPVCVQISVWLSRTAFQAQEWDLEGQYIHKAIAQGIIPSPLEAKDAEESSELYNSAIRFSAPLNGTYFESACAVPIPLIKQTYKQIDTNIISYVHVSCSFIDSSGSVWWIGPRKSFPLRISTVHTS